MKFAKQIKDKMLLGLVAGSALVATAGHAADEYTSQPVAEAYASKIASEVNPESFAWHLGILAGETNMAPGLPLYLQDRYTRDGLSLARSYIYYEAKKLGFDNVKFEVFQPDNFRKAAGMNIVFEIPGKVAAHEVILLGAHYDTTGKHKPGADDNASGVAAVFAIAEAMKKSGIQPDRTFRFILFDAEENKPYYQGSTRHFDEALLKQEHLRLFINMDMIGYSPGGHPHLLYDTGANPKILEFMKEVNQSTGMGFTLNAWDNQFYSDQAPAQDNGFPAVSIAEWPTDHVGEQTDDYPHYHTVEDTVDKLNIDYAVSIVRYVAALATNAAFSDRTWETQRDLNRQSKSATRLLKVRKAPALVTISNPQEQEAMVSTWDTKDTDRVIRERAIQTERLGTRYIRTWLRRFMEDIKK